MCRCNARFLFTVLSLFLLFCSQDFGHFCFKFWQRLGDDSPEDLVIEDHAKKYFIEMKSRLTIDTIRRPRVLKNLLRNPESRNGYAEFIVAGKFISLEIENIAHSCDIRIIHYPTAQLSRKTKNPMYSLSKRSVLQRPGRS